MPRASQVKIIVADPVTMHPPVTINPISAALGSIGEDQVLTLTDQSTQQGESAYVYIAYASDAGGTDFTNTFDPALKYIAVLSTNTLIVTPVVTDFTGLWAKYIGENGTGGTGGGGFTEYCGLVSQTGTNVPTDIVLKNDLGAITFSRISVGVYHMTTVGLYINNKTAPIDDIMMDQLGNLYTLNRIDANTMELTSYGFADISVPSDNVLNKRYINITVFE